MEVVPILMGLRRNKLSAALLCLQIALTVGIVCNALSMIQQKLQRMGRPSGLDEANIITLTNRWTGGPDDLGPRILTDLAALRSLPGVIDAAASNSFPLRGYGPPADLKLSP